ncbi:MAG: hydrogenase maturation protease [Pseudomonadota bacterium]|nr:hydrogenase maturation protease [Pseudomonadota bacterium]
MNRVRILGIGSPSGDDQAGWLVVDALQASGVQTGVDLVIEKLDRPGANLIASVENAAWVILVDAMQGCGEAGRIRRFGANDWPAYGGGISSHGFGVVDALTLARELGSLPHRLDLYGIEAGSALPGEEPSLAVKAAARRLAASLAAELASARQA